jgi:hypothetical protein
VGFPEFRKQFTNGEWEVIRQPKYLDSHWQPVDGFSLPMP